MILLLGARVEDPWAPVTACAALYAVSFFWRPNLLRALATLVGFSAAFTMLMEAVAATGRPLVDDYLLAADAWLGLSAPRTVAAVSRYPALSLFLTCAYLSVIPQTCIAIFALAERASLWVFLKRFIIAAQITLCFFYFFPAEGTTTNITPRIAARFYALRDGAAISWQQAQGIITFPSFHTAWALILTATFWHTRLRWPAVALNAVMIVSTVTTGGHYYVDVFAGALVGGLVISLPIEAAVVPEGRLSLRRLGRRNATPTSG
jgi:membrane-associated phospholipid phosphatase